MKKINKLKLNEITKNNLSQKQMKHVVGGGNGTCSCGYGITNCVANADGGYSSPSSNMYCVETIVVYG